MITIIAHTIVQGKLLYLLKEQLKVSGATQLKVPEFTWKILEIPL